MANHFWASACHLPAAERLPLKSRAAVLTLQHQAYSLAGLKRNTLKRKHKLRILTRLTQAATGCMFTQADAEQSS